jgi:hypothetical protein
VQFDQVFSPRQELQNRHRSLSADVMRGGGLAVVRMPQSVTNLGHGFVCNRSSHRCMCRAQTVWEDFFEVLVV